MTFDPAIFDPALFDTGSEPVTTLTLRGGHVTVLDIAVDDTGTTVTARIER